MCTHGFIVLHGYREGVEGDFIEAPCQSRIVCEGVRDDFIEVQRDDEMR